MGLVNIIPCLFVFPFKIICISSIIVGRSELRLHLDGLVKVRDSFVVLPFTLYIGKTSQVVCDRRLRNYLDGLVKIRYSIAILRYSDICYPAMEISLKILGIYLYCFIKIRDSSVIILCTKIGFSAFNVSPSKYRAYFDGFCVI